MTIFFAKKTKMGRRGEVRGKGGGVRGKRPGRTEARPIGANENPQRVEDTLWIACVGDAPVVVSPTLSVGDA